VKTPLPRRAASFEDAARAVARGEAVHCDGRGAVAEEYTGMIRPLYREWTELLEVPRAIRYSVNPRFSCGSPAQVDEVTARRVSVQERECIEHRASGVYGEEAKRLADDRRNWDGIVYCWWERRGRVFVEDLVTGKVLEFAAFEDFQEWGKANRARSRAVAVSV